MVDKLCDLGVELYDVKKTKVARNKLLNKLMREYCGN